MTYRMNSEVVASEGNRKCDHIKSDITENQILCRVEVIQEIAQGQLVIVIGSDYEVANKS